MQKLPKISLFFCLAGFIAVFSGSVFASDIQKGNSPVHTELSPTSEGDAVLYSTPFPVLLLSEVEIKSGSEIEPNESDTEFSLPSSDLSFDNKEYLKNSKQILLGLSIRDLIFPFHTHL